MNTELLNLHVKVYSLVGGSVKTDERMLAKFRVFLQDRPGSLADFASLIADCGGNISFFHYDRSMDSSRVVVEVKMSVQSDIENLLRSLKKEHYTFEKTQTVIDDVQITSLENVLEIRVRLLNKPGTLAAFANLLKEHDANVIYMLYDEDIDLESADIALATKDISEIDRLLDAINKKSYHYRVVYRGSDEKEVEHIIGLKQVEKFFMRLRKLLSGKDFDEIKSLVDSSQELYADLVSFYSETGNNLDAGDVFEKVLTLASKSRSRVGERFVAVKMPTIQIDGIKLYSFRLPTTENIYIFEHNDEMSMIDCGYGVYYEDIKALLRKKSLDPSKVKRIFLTHPDADHAGTAGYFADEFGTEVFIHPESRGVIEHDNRAYGVESRVSNLNKYYTRLINKFTECKFPEKVSYFYLLEKGRIGDFKIIDTFNIGSLTFDVMESHGGHIPGHVFFVNKNYGLFFTSDFLINVQSLSSDEKEILSVYRYLLTNPNSNSQLYKEESLALKEVIKSVDAQLKQQGRYAIIFPGHGDYYRVD